MSTALFPVRSATGIVLIAATVLASTIGFLDASVVNVAIPVIGADLGADVATLQWTLTSYLVTVASLLLAAGALADRYGRRKILLIGLIVTLVASLLCSLAPTASLLIATRVAQGVGGALVVPSSLALLNGTLRAEDRARGIGIWAGLSTLGTTLGPYGGGWLVDHASWRWLFILNVPLVLAAIGCLTRVPESRNLSVRGGPDVVGAVLAAVGVGGVIYALTDGAANGWGSLPVLLSGVVGLICLLVLVPYERRQPNPMLQLAVFTSRQFNAINASTLLFYGALSGAGFLLTLQLELKLGFSPTLAGAALIPSSAVFLAMSPFSGGLVARYGPRRLMAIGIFLVGVANVWLAFATPGSAYVTGHPAPGAAAGPRARPGGHATDRSRTGRRAADLPRRGIGRQQRGVTAGRSGRHRRPTGGGRGHYRPFAGGHPGGQLPAGNGDHRSTLCDSSSGRRLARLRRTVRGAAARTAAPARQHGAPTRPTGAGLGELQ